MTDKKTHDNCGRRRAAVEIGGVHVASQTEKRRSLGIYYTPSRIAEVLVRWAIRDHTDTILEPSFGGCALLDAAISRLRSLGSAEPDRQLAGFDVDPEAFVHLTRILPHPAVRKRFIQCDFLSAKPEAGTGFVSAVVSNPPFVSYHRMNSEQRAAVSAWRDRYAPDFPMTASLWAYFLTHAISFLAPGGRIAFVLPASSITSDYSKPILDQLRRTFERLALLRLNEQLFVNLGAEERAVIVLGEGYSMSDPLRRGLNCKTVRSIPELESAVEEFRDANQPFAAVPTFEHRVQITLDRLRSRGSLCTVGDVATVRIGEVVGDTSFFVKTADEWEELGVGPAHLVPILTRTRQVSGIRMDPRDLKPAKPAVPLLLRPNGARLTKHVAQYLAGYPDDAIAANCTFGKRDPWYNVSYDCSANGFIGSLSHQAPRVVLNSLKLSCANGLYKLTAANGLKWRNSFAAAALSTVTQISAELLARPRGAGALKLEPSDATRLLLPVPYQNLEAKACRELVNRTDTLLRRGQADAARDLVDEMLLIAHSVLTLSQLSELRTELEIIRSERLIRGETSTRPSSIDTLLAS
jgi:adenine-specific DNA-methyltransferase